VSSFTGSPHAARSGDTAGTLRLLAYLALGIVLLVLDYRGGWITSARSHAGRLVQPVWELAGLPGRLGDSLGDSLALRSELIEENQRLRNELLLTHARLTRMRNAAMDNAQLRELLGAAERRALDVQLAPILDIDLAPHRQRLVLAAGSAQGVERGQAVIDAGGLLGQVVDVAPGTATVLLLTDPDHAVPVTVARNGVRLIVYGRGDRLELRDVPLNRDVRAGDLLVTSGLGGRFPPGFPVATILRMYPDDSQAFLIGELKPAAQLDRGRDVLLLRPGSVLDDAAAVGAAGPVQAAGGPASDVATPAGAPAQTGSATPASAAASSATSSPAASALAPATVPAKGAAARSRATPAAADPAPAPRDPPAAPAGQGEAP
jgi:rod shape-determining protein MreC